jgi:hypothetical protein
MNLFLMTTFPEWLRIYGLLEECLKGIPELIANNEERAMKKKAKTLIGWPVCRTHYICSS